ncbi:uncharacterized protein LOC126765380 [Bactrocera neohumeralis]|uniref:zinc finger BED domain-containing protein RICESLEEPER 1-like n=1 Tax=Bactrocera tryoni TaxID=59916 RepID=UPI001A95EBE2|nr:zinc finger BED domain-containing protein RICESLEEPER 1-like [Bactrocera tryoni]XP_050339065.1 uncharacterized protein LOC126765380 [Bactrocera neohumeralis]
MVCVGKLFNNNSKVPSDENSNEVAIEDSDNDLLGNEGEEDEKDIDCVNDDQDMIENVDPNEQMCEELENDFMKSSSVSLIRCAAHTLNLAVSDFLKDIKDVRSKAKVVVKKLRTPTLLNLLRTKKLRKPMLECVTRWGSTYNMLKSLLEVKDFCCESSKDIKELYMTDDDWQQIESACDILFPAYNISLKLQNKQLELGDMFFAWYSCKLKVEQKTGWMSKNFAAALKKRGELLLNNSCVLAAVYLDPRYQLLLGDSEKELAKIFI